MQKKQPAFTLIEMLVVLSIMAILIGGGLAAFNTFNKRNLVLQAGKEIKNNLRLAQSKALGGEKDCSDTVCRGSNGKCTNASYSLDGWYVNLANGQVYGQCHFVSDTETFGTISFNIPNTVSVSVSPPGAIQFSPFNGGVTAATICVTGFNLKYKLSITQTGEIKDEGIIGTCP